MIEFEVTKDMLEKAEEKAKKLGELRNSVSRGEGNIAGYIGEMVVAQAIDADVVDTYDFDLRTKEGKTIDVKTKRTTVEPKEFYECSVAAFNTKQKCDYYAFVRVLDNYKKAWLLGYYPKTKYFEDARFLKKGTKDGSNGFIVKADCYNIEITRLLTNDCLS